MQLRSQNYEDIQQQLTQGRTVVAEVQVTDAWMSTEATKTGLIRPAVKERLLRRHAVVIGLRPSHWRGAVYCLPGDGFSKGMRLGE